MNKKFTFILLAFFSLFGNTNGQINSPTSTDQPIFETGKLDSITLNEVNYSIQKKGEFYLAKQGSKVGLLNQNKDFIIPPITNGKFLFRQTGVLVQQDGLYGLYDLTGIKQLDHIYSYIDYDSRNQSYKVSLTNQTENGQTKKYGIYKIGKGFLLEPIFCGIKYLNQNLRGVSLDCQKHALVSLVNEKFINSDSLTFNYENIYGTIDDAICVKKNGYYGLINQDESVRIPFQYDFINKFSEELYSVKKDNLFGIIDKKGNTVVPIENQMIHCNFLGDKVCLIKDKNGMTGLVNKELEYLINPIYTNIFKFKEYYIAKKSDKVGIIDLSEKEIIPFHFDSLEPTYTSKGEYAILAIRDTLNFIITVNGKCIENCPDSSLLEELGLR